MASDNGGIPVKTTHYRLISRHFCPDCSEVIFLIFLLAPTSHHRRLALPFLKKVLSSSPHLRFATIIYRKI